jgi:hypothetical protein
MTWSPMSMVSSRKENAHDDWQGQDDGGSINVSSVIFF